jgi:hypothetical protein
MFVHADTILPAGAAGLAADALAGGAVLGGFRIAFTEPVRRLRLAAALINVRTALTREPWGDQAQFILRSVFQQQNGFADLPIMEDYELARRMKRLGRTVVLRDRVRTSGRRFLRRGIVGTAALNWLIIAGYHLGIPAERLARWYRG